MAIQVHVQNRFQIIVPVRVDRAVRGAPVLDAPDVDDRGWVNNRAGGLNVADSRGALFGTTVGDVIRLKVVREDLDDGVPLFVTTTGNQVAVAQPAGGGPLPASGEFSVLGGGHHHGIQDPGAAGNCRRRRICEADAHTFTPSTVFITPHVCTIHMAAAAAVAAGGGTGQAPSINGNTLDGAELESLFDTIVRPVWRTAGIEFQLGAVQNEVFTGTDGFTRDNVALQSSPAQFQTVFGRNRVANTCNIYFMHTTDQFLGLGLKFEDRAVLGANNSGIMVGVNGFLRANGNFRARGSAGADLVQEVGNDTAHELGHFLNLPHADTVNSPGRTDTYNRRFLMHPNNLLPVATTPPTGARPRFTDIGYGQVNTTDLTGNPVVRGHRGCLLTLKDHPSHASDGEVVTVRRRLRSPNLFR